MFNAKTDDLIEKTVHCEYETAVSNYGKYYASKHEAYALLKEEVEEAKEKMDSFRSLMHIFWLSVRGKKIEIVPNYTDTKHIKVIRERALQTMKELAQVAAVCTKIEDSLENKKI